MFDYSRPYFIAYSHTRLRNRNSSVIIECMRRNSFCYNVWIKQLHYNRVPSHFLFTCHKCIILLHYYKFQVRQCINPIYWIEFFVWLPKRLTTFLGLNSELKAMKLVNLFFQLIYWAILLLKFFGYDLTPILHHVLP